MEITEIPFARHLGITQNAQAALELPFTPVLRNHLEGLHAGAQFALAETASGACLQARFPQWADRVVPVLRQGEVKFKKPAEGAVTAYPMIEEAAAEAFEAQLTRKGRALVKIEVALRDENNETTCQAGYTWFVQVLEP